MRNRRGAALLLAMVTALLCGIAAYSVLFAAVSAARQGKLFRERTQAQHAAEAGLVWAMQRLWQGPVDFTAGTTDLVVDGIPVDVVGACAAQPCQLDAKVLY